MHEAILAMGDLVAPGMPRDDAAWEAATQRFGSNHGQYVMLA
jgi:hypothetical protein